MATRQKATAMLRFKNGWERGYTQRDAALKLGVSVRTIQRMIARCDLRIIYIGRRKYITPIDIDHLLFKPSRLKQIIKEIDDVAAAFASNREWRRAYRKNLEGKENG